MPNVRLIPIVLFAAVSLLVLKTAGLFTGSGYMLGGFAGARAQVAPTPPAQPLDGEAARLRPKTPAQPFEPKRSWAQEVLGFPEVTGSVGPPKPASEAGPAPPAAVATSPPADKASEGTPVVLDERPRLSPGERAVLERLQERRRELESRDRELDIREGLLKAAEKRLEARVNELKQLETQVSASLQKKEEGEAERFKGLITMYENMKAKEAARIFDRLDLRVLIDVAAQINPRRMSDILAQMSPEAAERLTVELAARAANKGAAPANLPKIEGRPQAMR
ncbi:MAG TPA: flagellar protein FlbB [Xanthobacteraceae bacterium]|nr:flagellar protein FlbB [Xanthobacteraceae bacterium]